MLNNYLVKFGFKIEGTTFTVEVTSIFNGVGTAIGYEPDDAGSVPVVPAPALESAPMAQSV